MWKIVYKTRCHGQNPARITQNFQFSLWELPGVYFGKGWVSLERILALLGRLLGTLGNLWGASWTSLGRSWASLGLLLCFLGASWSHLERFGIDFGAFQGEFGRVQNKCFFILNISFSLNPKYKTQSNNFQASAFPIISLTSPSTQPLGLWVSEPLASKWPRRESRRENNELFSQQDYDL